MNRVPRQVTPIVPAYLTKIKGVKANNHRGPIGAIVQMEGTEIRITVHTADGENRYDIVQMSSGALLITSQNESGRFRNIPVEQRDEQTVILR